MMKRPNIAGITSVLLFCFIVTAACWHWLQHIEQYAYEMSRPLDTVDSERDGVNIAGDDYTFQIKHIFHHSAGKNFRTHRRLDITPEFLEKHETWFDSMDVDAKEDVSEYASLEEIYSSNDWPKIYKGKNPWTIELPIRKASKNMKIMRLEERNNHEFLDSYLQYAMSVKGNPQLVNRVNLIWEMDDVAVPEMADKETILSLATISSNAYVKFPKDDDEKQKLDWIDVGDPWVPDDSNENINFGWEDTGVRGHVFVSKDNKTVVIGIKGTSGAGLPGTGPEDTAGNDKVNDNLLFLCCCARVSYLWTTVCDCFEKTYTCNQDCLEKELLRGDRYYQAVLDIYRNVTSIYPPETTNIWLTGHSLGGSLASLLGRTYGLPTVALEAPGEMLATKRLHLPQPPGLPKRNEHIWHIGNTADPIYMGVCNGVSSSCNVAGYALETACHTGKQCVYDVVTDFGWKVNLLNHRIHTVIDNIIKVYNTTPTCVDQPPCHDCFNWRFTSRDDVTPDEPDLPNPLLPSSSSQSTTVTSTVLPRPSSPPHTCLRRNWFGRCVEWGDLI